MSLNTTPRTFVAGEIETAAIFNAEVRDAITGIQAAASTWAPTVTGVTKGTGFTEVARFARVGKWIDFVYDLTLGTSGVLTGAVSITLPVTALSAAAVRKLSCGYTDFSAGTFYPGQTYSETTTVVNFGYFAGATVSLVALGAAAPFTWAVSDVLHCHGRYEAA